MSIFDGPIPQREESYQYMIHNFEKMIDGDKIPHFDIRYVSYAVFGYIDEICEKYGTDIQKELVIWLKNEKDENRLFTRENWKSFRDNDLISDCYVYLGYNKLFQYKQYYFQLVVEGGEEEGEKEGESVYHLNCVDCIENQKKGITGELGWFELALYGWKDDAMEKLQPCNRVIVPPDNIMPLRDWNRKY